MRFGCSLVCGLGILGFGSACDDNVKPSPAVAAARAASAVVPSAAVPPTLPTVTNAPSSAPELVASSTPKKKPGECPKGPAVAFEQSGLETEVRKKLQKPAGPITVGDLRKVRSLNLAQASRMAALDACTFPHFTGLKDLFLPPGDYDDLSPLAELTQLESLSAANNQVSDVGPLAKLKKLDRLDLAHTRVADLTALSGLTALTELTLDHTAVTEVTPLAKLSQLEKLSIQHTRVKDASPLKPLKKLKVLYAADTPADEDGVTLAPLKANGTKVID